MNQKCHKYDPASYTATCSFRLEQIRKLCILIFVVIVNFANWLLIVDSVGSESTWVEDDDLFNSLDLEPLKLSLRVVFRDIVGSRNLFTAVIPDYCFYAVALEVITSGPHQQLTGTIIQESTTPPVDPGFCSSCPLSMLVDQFPDEPLALKTQISQ